MLLDKYHLQEHEGSTDRSLALPSASLVRRYSFFPCASSRAAPQQPHTVPAEAKRTSHARWRFATSLIAAALVVAVPIGMYFRAEVAAYVTRYAGRQDIFRIGMISGWIVELATHFPSQGFGKTYLVALQQHAEGDQVRAQAGAQDAAQLKQAVEASAPEAQQSLKKEQRLVVLANELAEARRAINWLNLQLRAGAANSVQLLEQERDKTAALVRDAAAARQELTASTEQHRRALEEERARSDALASDLATARREIETPAALLLERESDKTAALLRDATAARQELTASTEQHRRALEEERARSDALASELATARREIETQGALLLKTDDEVVHLKQAAHNAMAELRQSLQKERDWTKATVLESARRWLDERVTVGRASNREIAQPAQPAETAAKEQPAAAETQGSPEATRLIARAGALLGQGNISAARMVLERAAETGSARASFMLAETYDPVILSAWATYGTRGEPTKARELYAKAHASGIEEAKDRSDALR
jgi:rRNA maturation protein Rpf1